MVSVLVAVIPAKAGIQCLLDSGSPPLKAGVARNDDTTPAIVKPTALSEGIYPHKFLWNG